MNRNFKFSRDICSNSQHNRNRLFCTMAGIVSGIPNCHCSSLFHDNHLLEPFCYWRASLLETNVKQFAKVDYQANLLGNRLTQNLFGFQEFSQFLGIVQSWEGFDRVNYNFWWMQQTPVYVLCYICYNVPCISRFTVVSTSIILIQFVHSVNWPARALSILKQWKQLKYSAL